MVILDNPFRRLGLAATASPRDVRRRIDELSVKASLGVTPELPADELSRLRQALDDPVQRARHEIFWLHSSSDLVDAGLEVAAAKGSLLAALEALRGEAGGRPSTRQAIALHDLAVLSYARYLAAGNGADPGDALPLWASVLESEPFWQHIRLRSSDAADARLTPQIVEQIRSELPEQLLAPLASRAAAQVDTGELDAAAASVRAIRSSGFPSSAIDAAARSAIAPLRAKVEAGASAVEELIGAIPASEGASVATKRRLKEAERSLIDRVLVPMSVLRKVDPVSRDESIGDRAAAAARRLSVAVCNLLDDWPWGYALVREAMEMARTPSLLAQLAGDQALVCSNYHYGEAGEAAKLRRADLAAAHYELAIPYARSDEERTNLRNLAAGARAHGRVNDSQVEAQKRSIRAALDRRQDVLHRGIAEAPNRSDDANDVPAPTRARTPMPAREVLIRPTKWRRHRGLIGIAAIAVVAAVATIASTHSGSKASSEAPAPPAAPAVAVSSPAPQQSQSPQACTRVPPLRRQLDTLETRIGGKRRLVRRLHTQINPIETEIDQIIRDYPSHRLPSDVWSRFVPLRAKYRVLLAKSNRAVRDGNALIRVYNTKLKTYRRLNGEC